MWPLARIRSQSWQSIAGPWDGNISSIVSDFNNPAVTYASGSNGIWKSVDNGLTWKKVSAANSVFFDACATDNSHLITEDQKSTDGGNSWTSLSYPVSVSTYSDAIAINPNNNSELYLLKNYGNLYKSSNFGGSWSIVDDSTGIYPYYCTSIAVSKAWAGLVCTVGPYKYRRSTNSGATWTSYQYTSGSNSNSNPIITIDPMNANNIYIGGGNTLYKTSNGGSNWIAIPFPGLTISSITVDKLSSSRSYCCS